MLHHVFLRIRTLASITTIPVMPKKVNNRDTKKSISAMMDVWINQFYCRIIYCFNFLSDTLAPSLNQLGKVVKEKLKNYST